MLRKIMAVWKDNVVMNDVVGKLGEMIDNAGVVYDLGWEICTGRKTVAGCGDEVRTRDKTVNQLERDIRSMLAEHLTINPTGDVSGCLAIMIMAKDLERLGDHTRNIFGIGVRAEGNVKSFQNYERLAQIHKSIAPHFPDLKKAIVTSDEKLAHAILDRYKECKSGLKELYTDTFKGELPSKEAVCTTLLARFYMRINAHVGNAASGVIFPLQNIDFVSRGLKEEEKDR